MFDYHVNRFVLRGILVIGLVMTHDDAKAEPRISGVVTAVSGDVKVLSEKETLDAAVGQKVHEKDQLETGPGGMVQVRYADGDSFTVYEKALVKVSQYRLKQSTQKLSSSIDVAYGKLRFFVNPNGKIKKDIKFRSKSAVMGIRGTSGIIDVDEAGSTQLHVITGKVEVFNPRFPTLKVPVGALKMTKVNEAQAPTPPVSVPTSAINALVPPVQKASGFSEDSASASAEHSAASGGGEGSPSSHSQQNGNSEEDKDKPSSDAESSPSSVPSGDVESSSGTGRSPDAEASTDAGASVGSEEKPSRAAGTTAFRKNEDRLNSAPERNEVGQERDAREMEAKEQSTQSARRVRSKVTVFSPGGKVTQPPKIEQLPNVSTSKSDVAAVRNEKREPNSEGVDSEIIEKSELPSAGIETSKKLEKVSTQLKQVTTTTERTIESVTPVKPETKVETRAIRIKIQLPSD